MPRWCLKSNCWPFAKPTAGRGVHAASASANRPVLKIVMGSKIR
jgi:hypothetical protein